MAYASIAKITPQYDEQIGWWLKFYNPFTTTPISMSIDETGDTLLAKSQLDINGFPTTDGTQIFTPYLDRAYDAYLFPTEAEADANDTINAKRIAINQNPTSNIISQGQLIRLEDYVEQTDQYIEQAWDRFVADIENPSSQNYQIKTIIIGANPLNSDGKWEQFTPIQLFSDLHVISEGYLIDWVSTDDTVNTRRIRGMWEAIAPDPTVETTITAPINGFTNNGETTITVASTTGMSVGGYVEINVNPQVDFLTGVFPRVTRFNQVTEIIDSNNLKIDTPIYWDLPATTGIADVKFFPEETVPKNITIEGMRFIDTSFQDLPPNVQTPAYVIGPIFFKHVSRTKTIDCVGVNLKLPLVQYNRFHDVYAQDLESIRPTAREGGEGYTIQCSNGVHAFLENIKGQATRHVWDFTSVSHATAINCIADKPSGFVYADYTLHGQAEDHITIINCIGTNWGLDSDTAQFGGYTYDIHFMDCDFSGTTTPRQGLKVKYSNCYLGAWRSTSDGIAADIEFDSCRFLSSTEINMLGDTRVDGQNYVRRLVMEGTSRIRCSSVNISGFDSMYLGDEVEFYSAGASNGLITLLDIPVSVNKCRTENVVFSYQGECQDITIGAKLDLTENGATLISAGVRCSALTSSDPVKIKILPETFMKGKAGETTHKAFLIQQGSGTSTDCELTWNGGTFVDLEDVSALVNTLDYTGTINGVNFGSGGVAYVVSGTDSLLPSGIVAMTNYYADPSKNFEMPIETTFEQLTVQNGTNSTALQTTTTPIDMESTGFVSVNGISGATISNEDISLPLGRYEVNIDVTAEKSDGSSGQTILNGQINIISGDTKTIPLAYGRSGLSSSGIQACDISSTRNFTLGSNSVLNIEFDAATSMTIPASNAESRSFYLEINKIG